MPKGPAGGPRPFSEYRIIIDPHEREVEMIKVGPLGGPRPFAKDNPPVTKGEVAECMMSEAGQSFGAGTIAGEDRYTDLSAEDAQRALENTEDWCRGLLEAMAMEDNESGESLEQLTNLRNALRDATGTEADVSLEMVDEDGDVIPVFEEE